MYFVHPWTQPYQQEVHLKPCADIFLQSGVGTRPWQWLISDSALTAVVTFCSKLMRVAALRCLPASQVFRGTWLKELGLGTLGSIRRQLSPTLLAVKALFGFGLGVIFLSWGIFN